MYTLVHSCILFLCNILNLLAFELCLFYGFLVLTCFVIRFNLAIVHQLIMSVAPLFDQFYILMNSLTHFIEVSITVLQSKFNDIGLQPQVVLLYLVKLRVTYLLI